MSNMVTPEPFPALLRRLRQARGWSQARLAEELCHLAGRPTVTRQDVYRWECGRRRPGWWLPHLAVALEVPRAALERALAVAAPSGPTLASMLPTEPIPLAATGRQVGQVTADYFRHRVHAIRQADDVLPGRDLVDAAYRELDLGVTTARDGAFTESIGRQLLATVGELAQIAGWISYDAGDMGRAERTFRLGLSAAREAGDAVLAAQLASTLGYGWTNTGREADGLALVLAAVDEAGPAVPPRARALFWDRVAWGRTKVGDGRGAMRALGEAEQALAEHAAEDEPPWLYWVTPDELQIMEARVFTELSKPLRAVPILISTLARYDTTHVREHVLYQSWLAVAYTDANEPEEASRVLMSMLTASAHLGSDRLADRTRVVLRRLEPHGDVPEVAAVREVARAIGVC